VKRSAQWQKIVVRIDQIVQADPQNPTLLGQPGETMRRRVEANLETPLLASPAKVTVATAPLVTGKNVMA
jgi:hypothetical protein